MISKQKQRLKTPWTYEETMLFIGVLQASHRTAAAVHGTCHSELVGHSANASLAASVSAIRLRSRSKWLLVCPRLQ